MGEVAMKYDSADNAHLWCGLALWARPWSEGLASIASIRLCWFDQRSVPAGLLAQLASDGVADDGTAEQTSLSMLPLPR